MRTANRIRSGVLIVIFVLGLTFIPGGGAQAASCTWTGAADTAWGTAGNWSCGAVPGAADDVVIDGSVTAAPTITAVPTTTIKSLTVTNNAAATLTATAAAALTVNGGGTGLTVASGSSLTFGGGFAITMALASGTSGSVSGSMTFTGTASVAHRLTGFSASPITFQSGAIFTAGTNFSGNAFGTTSLNSVIFANGSTYVYVAGSNPFGASQPNSVVVFQTGSLYKHMSSNTPSFSGRTFANFELDYAAANISGTGTGALSIDNLTITNGRLNLNMTGTFNLKGNVSVASGATLTFTPASAATITFSGTPPQFISGAGTLTFGANANIAINSGASLVFRKNLSIPGTITATGGLSIDTGYTFSLVRNITVNGSLNVYGTLNTGTYSVTGTGSFLLFDSGALTVGSPDGITASAAAGNIQVTGGRNYGSGAAITYNGSAAQHAGNGLSSVGALTINNAAGVTLDGNVNVVNTLALSAGDLYTGAYLVELSPSAVVTGAGDVVGTVSHTVIPSAGIYYFNNATTFIQTYDACPAVMITLEKSTPSGLPLAIARKYQTPYSACTADLTLGYQQSEVGSIPENNLRAFLSVTGTYSVQPGSVDTTDNFVTTWAGLFLGDWAIAAYDVYPTGTGSATPASVLPGDTSLLQVNVVPGVNPASPVNVTCDLTPIGGSASQALTESPANTFTYTATVPSSDPGGTKTFVCTVSDDLARATTTNISLTVATLPDLTVALGAPGTVFVNTPFDYTLAVANIGAVDASGITVQFTLPAGLTYNSATVSNGFTAVESGGVITFSGGSITAGDAAALTVNVTAATPGTYTAPANAAIADPSNAILETNESNNGSAEVTTTVPAPTNPSGAGSASPNTVAQTAPTLLTVAVTPGLYPTSTGLDVSCDLTGIGESNPTVFTDAGGNTFTYSATVSDTTPAGAKSLPCTISDAEGRTGSASISLTVLAVLPIGTVNGPVLDTDNGATHYATYYNQWVVIKGVIFEKTYQPRSTNPPYSGFFIQNTAATADADPNTSDGLYVYMGTSTTINVLGGGTYTPVVGDEVILYGKMTEYYNMTELSSVVLYAPVVRSGVDLDAELPPFIADPPANLADANRYWERHQGMRAQIPVNAIVLGGRSVFNPPDAEVWLAHPDSTIALRAEAYERRAFRDSSVLDDNYDPANWDGNGYRILMGSWGIKWTEGNGQALIVPASTFDIVTNAPVGGVNYSFSKYRIEVTTQPVLSDGADPAANNPPQTFDRGLAYSIADYNLENLYDFRDNPFSGCDFAGNTGCPAVAPFLSSVSSPFDYVPSSDATYQARLNDIALQIINDLHSPDVLAVQEIENQDICVVTGGALVCGSTDNADGKPDVLQELALRIAALGGPAYDAAFDRNSSDLRGIAPAFLYRTDRVELVSPAGDPLLGATPAIVYAGAGVPANADVSNPKTLNAVLPAGVTACEVSWVFPRAPDIGLFRIHRDAVGGSDYRDVYIINNHFKSGPDSCVAHRTEQANYNAAIVAFLQSANPDARVIVAGDLNVYPRPDNTAYGATDQLAALYDPSISLTNLWDVINATHPASAYSYVYLGMAQTLDQMFVNQTLLADLQDFQIAHINSDFPADYTGDVARGTSDHDPNVAVFEFNQAPTALNLSNSSVAGNLPVGTLVGLFSTVDPNSSDTFTYTLAPGAGDADNASFSIAGNELRTAAVFNALVKNTYLIRVRTTDNGGLWFEQTFTITVTTNSYVPSLIAPANGEHLLTNRPDFDWTDVPGARFYQWQVSRTPTFAVLHSYATTSVSQYTPARELFFPEQLYWRVRAYGPWGYGPWTTAFTFFTANAPRTPVLVSPVNNYLTYDYTPRLDWVLTFLPVGTTLDYYQVQVATDAAFSALVIDEKVYGLVNSEYTPTTDLNPNTKYFWRVRAFNTAGEYSGWSLTRYFRTAIAQPVLTTPANGSTTTNRKPVFDWDDANGATLYTIQVSRNSTFTSLVLSVNVTASTYTPLTNLPLGTLYWRVRAYGANGPSLWSPTFNFTEQ